MKLLLFLVSLFFSVTIAVYAQDGKVVFEAFCWGCHHQTAEAFGPPFAKIAFKRDANEIRAMIVEPNKVSKIFGYKRNAMPSFKMSEENLSAITNYILSFKEDNNQTKREK